MTIENAAITQQAEETEQQLIDTAAAAVRQSNWSIGESASKWTERYAAGRTDADFAELIGCSQPAVNLARRVFDRFLLRRNKHDDFTWTQWRTLLTWDDAEQLLDWAETNDATFNEMRAWRRANRGEDLHSEVDDGLNLAAGLNPTQAPEPHPPIVKPKQPVSTPRGEPLSAGTSEPEQGPAKGRQEKKRDTSAARTGQSSKRSPSDHIDLKQAAREAIKALRQLGTETDIKSKRATAAAIRKLADEFDPPATDIPPPIEDVKGYCRERDKGVNAEAFWDFYQSKGWVVGKTKMRDWRASVRSAEHGGYFREASDGDGYGKCPF